MALDLILLLLVALAALAAVRMQDLLGAGMMLSVYSLVMAVVWTRLNAVDVAFTEAAVGAGITTVLLIATLSRTRRHEARHIGETHSRASLLIVALTGAVLVWGTLDMPRFMDPEAPAHKHVAPRYINDSLRETAQKNMVTALLAGYRGYDTLGETTVIFTAGAGLILLLRRSGGRGGGGGGGDAK